MRYNNANIKPVAGESVTTELTVIDKNFKRIKVIKAFKSLQWTERYFYAGEFELHCDIRFLDALFKGEYIFRKDKRYMGRIEYRKANPLEQTVMVQGRFLEAILTGRVIETTTTFNGIAEDICRQMVTDFCLTGDRAIPRLTLGAYNGLGSELSIQRTGKSIYEAVNEILTEQELSFRIEYDLPTTTMRFEVFQGLDRTISQNINKWCVFSSSRYNVLEENYESSNDIKNFAYVAGEDRGANRVIVTVDITNGEERKELYVDARDLQKTDGISDEDYKKSLYDRGLAKLSEYNVQDTVECVLDVNNTSYFELGDKCTYYSKRLGITAEGRVTEIYEIIEDNSLSTKITLGKEQLNIVQKIKRGES